MLVEITCVCQATLTETWRISVPDGLEGDALNDAAAEALLGGGDEHATFECIDEQASDEHDRQIVNVEVIDSAD